MTGQRGTAPRTPHPPGASWRLEEVEPVDAAELDAGEVAEGLLDAVVGLEDDEGAVAQDVAAVAGLALPGADLLGVGGLLHVREGAHAGEDVLGGGGLLGGLDGVVHDKGDLGDVVDPVPGGRYEGGDRAGVRVRTGGGGPRFGPGSQSEDSRPPIKLGPSSLPPQTPPPATSNRRNRSPAVRKDAAAWRAPSGSMMVSNTTQMSGDGREVEYCIPEAICALLPVEKRRLAWEAMLSVKKPD